MNVLGVVIAGGASTRYGTPKALAEVGGTRVVDRVVASITAAVPECVAIVNDPAIASAIGLPHRPDVSTGIGPLAGLLTALRWAGERGDDAILAVGCDMPFVSASLLRAIVRRLGDPDSPDAVLPESGGPRGVEPLCAAYRVTCAAAIDAAIASGDHRMIGFHQSISVATMNAAAVRAHGDPDTLFLNINSPADRDVADRLARTGGHG